MAGTRADDPLGLEETIERARRLERVAADICSAAEALPGVDLRVVMSTLSFAGVLQYVHDVGAAQKRREVRREIAGLEEQIARLERERASLLDRTRSAADANPPGSGWDRDDPQGQQAPGVADEAPPVEQDAAPSVRRGLWVGALADAVAAEAAIAGFGFFVADRLRTIPDTWPAFIQVSVRYTTHSALAHVTEEVVRGAFRPREGPEAYLRRYTRRILGLGEDAWSQVGEVLSEGRWEDADNPLAYLAKAGKLAHRNATGRRPRTRRRDAYDVATPVSLDAPSATGDPLAALIGDEDGTWRDDAHTHVDLEQAIRRSGLSTDAETIAWAKLQEVTRHEAAAVLGWTPTRVEAAWRALNRARPRLRDELSP